MSAGPLDPPAGPVAATHKTLTEVEPRIAISSVNTPGDANSLYRIAAPGSYYLTGNIMGGAARHGIEVASSGVTINLNGFELTGGPGSLDGVNVSVVALRNVIITNGSIRGWGGNGVTLAASATAFLIRDVASSSNTGYGFLGTFASSFVNCVARDNGQSGFSLFDKCIIEGCTSSNNATSGIVVAAGSAVIGCVAADNGLSGIDASLACRVTGCIALDNDGDGINTGAGTLVAECSAYSNSARGIVVSSGSTVTRCNARLNQTNGIEFSSQCLIRDNISTNSGDANIFTSGADSHIEGNHCNNGDVGIEVSGSRNIIIRNTCAAGLVNWVIAANNIYGPIVDRSAAVTAAVNGNAAADVTASTHPNSNFTH